MAVTVKTFWLYIQIAAFVVTGIEGIYYLFHYAQSGLSFTGWFAGFVFCSSGVWLFEKRG